MTSIINKIMQQLDVLHHDYSTVVQEPKQFLDNREAELREENKFIHAFTPVRALTGRSLVTVDGGRATRQMSGGADLIVVAATCADGLRSAPLMGVDPVSEAVSRIIAHDSDNDSNLAGRLMSALELRVLEQTGADHTVIDGAFLANVSEVIFGLLGNKPKMLKILQEQNQDGLLQRALHSVLTMSQGQGDLARIIAVVKSDSSYVQSKQLFGQKIGETLPDRTIASHFLRPGEFLEPRPVEPNPVLISEMSRKYSKADPEVQRMLRGCDSWLQDFGGTWDNTYENRLYTVYFKPSLWHKHDRALKVEFVYAKTTGMTLLEHTERVIQIINDDVVDNSIMEPYSQYVADLRAKEVSDAMNIVEDSLVNIVSSSEEANQVLRSYRT